MPEKTKRTISWTIFFGIAFLMIGIGFASFWTFSFWSPAVKAVTTNTVIAQVEVGNDSPTFSSVYLDLPTALAENSTITATCTATVIDLQGGNTVEYATATMYLDSAGASCDDDDNDCYTQIACSLGDVSGNNVYATCTEPIWFFAVPGEWNCKVIAEDNQAATGSSMTIIPVDMPTLNALQITSSIDYEILSTGATSSASQTTIATTTGNAALDLLASSTDFILAGNGVTIGGDEQVYSLIDNPYESMTSCSTTSYDKIEAVLIKPTQSPSNSFDTVYWKMKVPSGTAAGTYNSTTSIVATPDS